MIEREITTVRLAKAEFSEENRVSTGAVKAEWLWWWPSRVQPGREAETGCEGPEPLRSGLPPP
jgi:hypothetical protein